MAVELSFVNSKAYFLDFDELQPVFHIDIPALELLFDESIGIAEVLAEGVVSIDYGEARLVPTQKAGVVITIPDILGQEEVVVLDFSVEGPWGNVEDGLAPNKVVQESDCLVG